MKRAPVVVAVLFGLIAWSPAVLSPPAAGDFDTPQWDATRKALFQDRAIKDVGDDVVLLEVPARPDDAAAVPVLVKVKPSRSQEASVKSVYIVIDKNPEPLAGVFRLTPDSGLAEVQTRLRVETHSPMRAIAEMSDGSLYMSTKLVKAAGGCAAPPVMATLPPNLGQIQIRTQETPTRNEPNWAQLIVVHPNHTGFQRHPLTALPISAHYVTEIAVSYGGHPVLDAQTTIAMSEDPDLRFYFTPKGPGSLNVEVKDSRGQHWAKAADVAVK
jgi:sulfur-oxidizing protein SoxY